MNYFLYIIVFTDRFKINEQNHRKFKENRTKFLHQTEVCFNIEFKLNTGIT